MERQRSILFMPISMSSSNFFKQIQFGRKNYTAQKSVLFAQKIEITTPPIFLVSTMSRKEREEARSPSIIRPISMNLFALTTQNSTEFPKSSVFLKLVLRSKNPYGDLFDEAATEFGLETIFSSTYGHPLSFSR